MSRLVAAILVLLLSACSQLVTLTEPADIVVRTDEFIADNQYDRAFALYQQLTVEQRQEPRIQKNHSSLQAKAEAYEIQVINESGQLVDEGLWSKALELLDEALSGYESSVILQEKKQVWLKQRDVVFDQQWQAFNVQRAEQLLKERKELASVISVDASSADVKKLRKQYLAESQWLSSYIAGVANAKQQANARYEALKLYRLAQRLDVSNHWQAQIAELEKKISSQKKSRDKKVATGRKQQLQIERDKFQSLLREGKLLAAKQQLAHLETLADDKKLVTRWQQSLADNISHRVKKLTSAGKEHYTNGELDKAIALWSEALAIDPQNQELVTLYRRAETFKAHYEKLQGEE